MDGAHGGAPPVCAPGAYAPPLPVPQIADFWSRAANCDVNPYYYTDRYNQKEQAAGAKGARALPEAPRSPAGSCSGEDDGLMGNDVEAGGRA